MSRKMFDKTRIDAPPHELVSALVSSFDLSNGWVFDDLLARNSEAGVHIWFYNELDSLSIETQTHRYGGATVFGCLFRWRFRLHRAAIDAKRRQPVPNDICEVISRLYHQVKP